MISFVYFDVGGVVIKDFSETNKWQEFLTSTGMSQDDWATNYGGKIDVGIFPENPKIHYNKLISEFVDRFETNPSIWPIIAKTKEHYKVGLLTNMYPGMLNLIKSHNLLPKINWDVIIDSSIEKVAKPDPKIFEIAQNKSGVSGKEILFVENSEGHIKAAADFGWQTFWYDSKNYEDSSNKLETFFLNESRSTS